MPLGSRQHSAPPAQREKRENGGTIRPPKPEWGPKKYIYSGKVNVGGQEWMLYLFPPNSPGDYYNVSFVKPEAQPQRRPAYQRPQQDGYQDYDERNPPPRGDEPF